MQNETNKKKKLGERVNGYIQTFDNSGIQKLFCGI